MMAIIKLRLRGLKEDYKIMLVMALLALAMVYAFSAQGGQTSDRVVFITFTEPSETADLIENELKAVGAYDVRRVDEETGRGHIENNEGLALLVFDADLDRQIETGHIAIQFFSTKNDVDIQGLKQNMENILIDMHADWTFSESLLETASEAGIDRAQELTADDLFDKLRTDYRSQGMFRVSQRTEAGAWNAERRNLRNFLGFSLLFSAYTIVFGIGEIINDKMYHTWQRLLQTPISQFSILSANLITTLLVGFLQLAVIFAGGRTLFGIDLGSRWDLILLICLSYIFSLTGMGLFLASMVKTQGQLSASVPIFLTSFAMLGGCMWPLEIVSSKVLLALSLITPHRWALEGLQGVTMKGANLIQILQPLAILFFMGMLFVILGSLKLANEG
jgi:ABC-2 type transport system permease protein